MENEKTETMKNESESIEHIKEENTIEKNVWFKEPMKIKPIFSEEKPDNKIENADPEKSGQSEKSNNKTETEENNDDVSKGDDDIKLFEKFKKELKDNDNVNLEKFKTGKDFLKSYVELEKKTTKLSQELSEIKKKSEGSTDNDGAVNNQDNKDEKKSKDESKQFAEAIENYDYETAIKLFQKLEDKVENLSKFEKKYVEDELQKKQDLEKKEKEELRLDIVEDTFKNFSKDNKLTDDIQQDIRDFMTSKGKFADSDINELLQDKLLIDEINDNNKEDYQNNLKKAFKIALKLVESENAKIEAENAKKNLNSATQKIKNGTAVIQPKQNASKPNIKSNVNAWFRTNL